MRVILAGSALPGLQHLCKQYLTIKAGVKLIKQSSGGVAGGDKTLPLPHNLYDYCSIRISSLVEKYLVVKRKISFVDKGDILLTKLIIRGGLLFEKENR